MVVTSSIKPQTRTNCILFDHLVGDCEHAWWNRQAEGLGRLEVDDQLKFGRLYDRQVGWLLALENPAAIGADLVIDAG